MLGPFTTASRLTPIHQMLLAVLSRAACASMSTTTPTTTTTTTTTTTRDRGDRYGPMEMANKGQMKRRACGIKVKFHGSSLLVTVIRMLLTSSFSLPQRTSTSINNSGNSAPCFFASLPICRVFFQIPRARHARRGADMLAKRQTIWTCRDGLKVANILVASS